MRTTQTRYYIPGIHTVKEAVGVPTEPEPTNRRVYAMARGPFVALFGLGRWLVIQVLLAALSAAVLALAYESGLLLLQLVFAYSRDILTPELAGLALRSRSQDFLVWAPRLMLVTGPLTLLGFFRR